MPWAERGGCRIHYETFGDPKAPPLLLIMGLGLSSRAWGTLPERLAQRFSVLVFDNRGTGRSGRAGWLLRMRDLADDAAAVLEAAGLPPVGEGRPPPGLVGPGGRGGAGGSGGAEAQRGRAPHGPPDQMGGANVFGVSMGGMIAQELALQHPERVRALALGATFAGWLRSAKPTVRTLLELLRLNLDRRIANRNEDFAPLLVSRAWREKNPAAAVDWIRTGEQAGILLALAQMSAVVRHATHRRLAQIRVPTLVITGDEDRLVPPINSRVLSRLIPGAKLVVLEGAGHVFPLEREEETIRALTEHFLGAS